MQVTRKGRYAQHQRGFNPYDLDAAGGWKRGGLN